MHTADVVVFLGPTLPTADARRMLPARYLGPARCGDVLRARRLRPRAIAIVDGVFARTAAVWHKEVLVALDEGIDVYGASSMGALRAAELATFGMIGVGRIFEAYRDGVYTDDDEVALLHGPAESGYREMSEAMVNIRATMAHAVVKGIVGSDAAEAVIRDAKATFYQERVLVRAIDRVWGTRAGGEEAVRLKHFVSNGGYVNQKRLDALELLGRLASKAAPAAGAVTTVNRSTYLLKLHHDVMCAPFDEPQDALPAQERVALRATTLGPTYQALARLARMLAVVYGFSCRLTADADADDRLAADDVGPGGVVSTKRWAEAQGLDSAGHVRFRERLSGIRRAVAAHRRRLGASRARRQYERALLALLRIDGTYERYAHHRRSTHARTDAAVLRRVARADGVEDEIYRVSATLWAVIGEWCTTSGIVVPTPQQELADVFRRARSLLSREATLDWLRANNLGNREFASLVLSDALVGLTTSGAQAYVLGLHAEIGQAFWLLDAVRLVGLYRDLAREVDPARTTRGRARRRRSPVQQ